MPDVTINLEGHQAFKVIVEPWACEFHVGLGEQCMVVVQNPRSIPKVSLAVAAGSLLIFVNDADSTFRFMRGDVEELDMPIATIALPRVRSIEKAG